VHVRFAVLLLAVALPATVHASSPATLSGSATYRERMALPPHAVFEATLEDVSRADGPSTVLGRVLWRSPGQVPIRFEIPYTRSIIKQNRRYAVRARITAGDRVLFTTDRAYPVLGADGGTRADVILRRARDRGPDHGGPDDEDVDRPPSHAPLENTYWTLVRIGDRTVTPPRNRRPPHLVLEPKEQRVRGSGGCNTLGGPYTLDGSQLRFGRLFTTRMACVEGMDVEARFFEMLEQVRAWSVSGERLELLDSSGRELATFERYLE
jgi:putative lipoprotein